MSDPTCRHPGGFRTNDGGWECSRCGQLFASYEAWGTETGNEAAVAAVKRAIERDLATMKAAMAFPVDLIIEQP